MKPTKYIWYNGKYVKWKNAKTHILSHTLHYGGGVFEGIRFYATLKGPAIFRLDDHLRRLESSLKSFYEKLPYAKKELISVIKKLIKKNHLDEGYIRIIAFFGYKNLGVSAIDLPINVAIAVYPWNYLGKSKVRVKTAALRRLHPSSTNIHTKVIGHYFNSMIAGREAKKAGYDEALMLDHKGYVAEGSAENIFMVKDGVIYTPTAASILPGLTRDSVIKIARDIGFKVVEKNLTLNDFYTADECFFTGTAAEITPIIEIDAQKIGQGKFSIIKLLKKEFIRTATGRNQKYYRWVTVV